MPAAPDFLQYAPADILKMGQERGLPPEQIAQAVTRHRDNIAAYGQQAHGDAFMQEALPRLQIDTERALADLQISQQGPLGTIGNKLRDVGPAVVGGLMETGGNLLGAGARFVGLPDSLPQGIADTGADLQAEGQRLRPTNPANVTANTIGSGLQQGLGLVATMGAAAPVVGAKAAIGTVPLVMGGIQGGGQGVMTARDMGITSPAGQLAMGGAYGAAEILAERLGGVGSKGLSEAVQQGIAGTLKRAGKTLGSEAIEEPVTGFAQDAASYVGGKFVEDPNRPGFTTTGVELPKLDAAMLERRKQEAIGGAAGGTVFAGLQLALPNAPLPPTQTATPSPTAPNASLAAQVGAGANQVPSTLSRIAAESVAPEEDTGALTPEEVSSFTSQVSSPGQPATLNFQPETSGEPTASVTKDSGVTADNTAQNTPGAGLSPAAGASSQERVVSTGKPNGAQVSAVIDYVEAADLEPLLLREVGADQTRDRANNRASAEQIAAIATSPDAQLLGDSPVSLIGAPVVDDKVLAGNGRAEGLIQGYRGGGAGIANYRAQIVQQAAAQGRPDVAAMKQPVMIRRVTNYMRGDRRQFVTESNPKYAVLQETVAENALLDAEVLGDMSGIEFTQAGQLTSSSLQQVATKLKEAQRGINATTGGKPDVVEGTRRVQLASLAKLAKDNGVDVAELSGLLETDVGRRAVAEVSKAAPRLAALDADLGLGDVMLSALRSFSEGARAVSQGIFKNLTEWADNRGQELIRDELSPEAGQLLEIMIETVRTPTKLRELFDTYLEDATNEQDQRNQSAGTADIFGDARTNVPGKQILRRQMAGATDTTAATPESGSGQGDGQVNPDPLLLPKNFTGGLAGTLQGSAATLGRSGTPEAGKSARAPFLQAAYAAAARGSSTQMLPIRAVYEQARAQNPALTPAQFMAEVQAGDAAGTVLLEPFDSPQGVQEAGEFVVRNASGVPSTRMMVAAPLRNPSKQQSPTVSDEASRPVGRRIAAAADQNASQSTPKNGRDMLGSGPLKTDVANPDQAEIEVKQAFQEISEWQEMAERQAANYQTQLSNASSHADMQAARNGLATSRQVVEAIKDLNTRGSFAAFQHLLGRYELPKGVYEAATAAARRVSRSVLENQQVREALEQEQRQQQARLDTLNRRWMPKWFPTGKPSATAAWWRDTLDERDAEERKPALSFIARVWRSIAQQPEAFQFGKSTSKSASDIAAAVSVPGKLVTVREAGDTIRFIGKEGHLDIHDADTWEPYIRSTEAGSKGKQSGGGSQLYQAALDWIHNNGKTIKDDPAGITAINDVRRTSNFASSALRWGTTEHLQPHADQGVPWGKSAKLNTASLLTKEMDNAFKAVAIAKDWTYDFILNEFLDSRGNALSQTDFSKAAVAANPGASGIGMATLQRAVLTRSTLEAFQRGDTTQPLSETGVGSGQLAESLEGILYNSAELNAAQKANESKLAALGLPTKPSTRIWARGAVATALKKIAADTSYPATMRAMADLLSKVDLNNLLLKIEGDARLSYAGKYQPLNAGRGEISLNTRVTGRGDTDIVQSLVHELLHHATFRALRSPKNATQRGAIADLEALRKRALAALSAQEIGRQFDYELSNTDEFIAALFTRADFQTALAGIPADLAPKSLSQRVRSVLDEIFRVLGELVTGKTVQPGSVLEASFSATLRLMENGEVNVQARLGNAIMTHGPGPVTILQRALRAVKAYHGTPHKVDKFSTGKIGTGEGAQAYGWGLYFAQGKAVAESYRNTLSKPDGSNNALWKAARDALKQDDYLGYDTASLAMSGIRSTPNWQTAWDMSPETVKAVEAYLGSTGNLYTVELLPNEDEFLDWDKPLSEQSEKVKEALAAFDSAMTGRQIYADVTQKNVAPRYESGVEILDYDSAQSRASRFLESRGIPGIRYLDGNSRADGTGARNFVVFDEKHIRITEENGQPVPGWDHGPEMPALLNPALNPFTPSDAPGWVRTLFKVPSVGEFRVRNLSVRQLLTGSALPKAMAEIVTASTRDKQSIEYAAATLANDLERAMQAHSKATGQSEQAVNDLVREALQGNVPASVILNPDLKTAIRRARYLLDSLSVAVGTATGGGLGQTIMQNLGQWMRRSFAAFDPAAGWSFDALTDAAKKGKLVAGMPAAKILSDARRYLRAQPGAAGMTNGELEAQMRKLMDRNIWEEVLTGTGAGVSKDVTSLMKRKDIAPEILALMGEERNPVKNLLGSAKWQAQFVAKHDNQVKLRDLGLQLGMMSTTQEGRFTEALGEDRRSSGFALNGKSVYTTPELRAALNKAVGVIPTEDLGGALLKTIYWLGGQAKLNKVALNPDSWLVNLLGNVSGLAMTGALSPFAPMRLFQNSRKAIELMRAGNPIAANGTAAQTQRDLMRAMMVKLTAAGVADSSMNAALVEDALNKNLIQFIQKHDVWNGAVGAVKLAVIGQALVKPLGVTARLAAGAASAAGGYLIGNERVQNVQEAIAKWTMQNPDRFGKIVEFLDNHTTLLAAGMPAEQAFAKATTKTLNTMPDYSKLPPVLRQFSRLGVVGSFIAFQWEVYRNSFHNAKYIVEELGSGNPALMEKGARRLLGMSAVYALALGGLQAILGNSAGDDDKDEAYRRALGKPWEKFGRLAYSRLDTEKASFYNTSYLLPQVTLTEIVRAAAEGKTFAQAMDMAGGVLQKQFAETGIHADPLIALLFNIDKGGQKATTEEGWRATAERLGEVLAPMTPGAADKFERILRAGLNQPRWDREFSIEEEMKRLLGMRQATYSHDRRIAGRLAEFNSRKRDIGQTAAQTYGETGKAKADVWGKQQQQQAAARATERLTALKAEYDQFVKDLGTLGFKPTQIERFRKDAGTSPNWKPYGITPEGIKQP